MPTKSKGNGKRIILSAILALCLVVPNAHAKFRALLVGVDYQGADPLIPRLGGAVNDVGDMRDLMTQNLGIDPSSIKTLIENQATRDAILQTFQAWLIQGTEPGDMVFFQYAGHGVQVPDPFGTQAQDPFKSDNPGAVALAEAFAPYDTTIDKNSKTIRRLIFDTEFHALLKQLSGRNTTLFLDCCHSGGVTRDFIHAKAATRFLELPWEPWQSRSMASENAKFGRRGDIIRQKNGRIQWNPEYSFFAAVRYFQSAHEYPVHNGKNGAFTKPVLDILRANPQSKLTNRQVLAYATSFIRDGAGICESLQSPLFMGPKNAEEQPFVLLSAAAAGARVSDGQAPPIPKPVEKPEKMTVWVTGLATPVRSDLIRAVRQCDFATVSDANPYAVVEVSEDRVNIYHTAGKRIASVEHGMNSVGDVMQRLEREYVVLELATLENPKAPFSVDMWIDSPGKHTFGSRDRVTLYYRVNRLPGNQSAYFTLVNAAPDGAVSILYPGRSDMYEGPGNKRFVNAPVAPGVVHSIPKNLALSPGQNVAVDLRIRLAEGQEYFKGIVTSEPVDWENLGLGRFRSSFQGDEGRTFAKNLKEGVVRSRFWGTGSLRVEVNP